MTSRTIDSHAHVWQLARGDYDWLTPDLAPLYRDHDLSELEAAMDGVDVAACVLVQAAPTLGETSWLISLARQHTRVEGIVGWLDLDGGDLPGVDPLLVGLRAMPSAWAATTLDDPAFDRAFAALAYADLVFDALVEPAHLPGLERRIERTPGLRVVVDHGGNPIALDEAWHQSMRRLANLGVWIKLSGWPVLPLFADPATISRAVTMLIELFGDRVLWGSDWPVVTAVATYAAWHSAARAATAALPATLAARVFGGAAAEVYRLRARA